MLKKTLVFLLVALVCGVHAGESVNKDLSQYRELPLRELKTVQTLNAADFGATPDDGKDDWQAFRKALNALAEQAESAKLVVAPGRYLLNPPDAKPGERYFCLILDNCTNAVVDFQGSEIIVQNPSRGFFRVDNSENVIVQNATVEYDPVPHTEGIIRAFDPQSSTIDLKIRDGFPAPDLEYFQKAPARWGCQMDPDIPGRLKTGSQNHCFYSEVRRLKEGLFRVGLKNANSAFWESVEIGDRFCLLARNYGSFFQVRQSRQVTALNLTSYNTPAGHYVSVMTEAFNVIGCKSPIKPGFWKGGNADAVHCQSNRIGPWIEDCLFEGISDDSLVIYARPFSVVEQLAPTRLKISRLSDKNNAMPLYKGEVVVGDVLDFLNPETGVVLASATVTSYDKAAQVIELDHAVSGLSPGIDKRKTQIWNRAMGSGFVMKNNVLKNSRRYGVYLKASNGLIEGNHFEGLSSCAITLHNEPHAPNGPFCHNVTIRNNVITECGFEGGFLQYPDIGALRVTARRLDYRDAETGTAHGNLLIENNRFSNLKQRPISLSNVDGVVVRGNTLNALPLGDGDVLVKSSKNTEVEK